MGYSQEERDYESLRKARISQNKAKLASLNLDRCVDELRSIVSFPKSTKKGPISPRNRKGKVIVLGPPRRSDRLKGKVADVALPLDRGYLELEQRKRFVLPAWKRMGLISRGGGARGSAYDPVLGICCHFCRQKKLCAEEDCNRCNTGDINQSCTGKTECSVCHSTNGILCRACLKVRYGEDMEEVRRMKNWMCPHCIEEQGIRPYWICNSSLCLKKRKMTPTGIAIYHAREKGYKSVAHQLMDELQKAAGKRLKG